MHRQSDYTDALASEICGRLVDGESLRSICADDRMPDKSTVFRWLDKHEAFRDQYARARRFQAETYADETIDIADDAGNDWMERNDPDNPGWQFNGEAVARARLRVDARKWAAGKLDPKKYSDKQVHEHTGEGGGPIQAVVNVTISGNAT